MAPDTLRQAFEALFLNQRKALIGTLFRIVGCRHTAEDLAHESYMRVSSAIGRQPIDHLQPFLYRTARNLAFDHLRRRKIHDRIVDRDADATAVLEVASRAPSPETETSDRQRLRALDAALARLPERTRRVLVLHRVHGWNYPRIAAHFGVSESTVYNDIRLATAHCIAAFGKLDDD